MSSTLAALLGREADLLAELRRLQAHHDAASVCAIEAGMYAQTEWLMDDICDELMRVRESIEDFGLGHYHAARGYEPEHDSAAYLAGYAGGTEVAA